MKHIFNQLKISLQIIFVVVVILIAVIISKHSNLQAQEMLSKSLLEHKNNITELAKISDRNATNDTIAKIISDCPRRVDYDSYLMRLSSLTKPELITMQNLFESCSPFYVQQKALVVLELEHEFNAYNQDVELLKTLGAKAIYEKEVHSFKSILEIEKERSSLLAEQTDIQGKIISLLISGKSSRNPEVVSFLSDAGAIAEQIAVLDHRADDIRAKW